MSPSSTRVAADAVQTSIPVGRHTGTSSGLGSQPLYVWFFLLGLAGNLLSGQSHHLGLPISPDRVFLPLAIFLLAMDPNRPRLRARNVHWLMLAFVAWTIVSMVWHGNLTNSVAGFALLDRTILPFLMFIVGPMIFSDRERRDLLLKVLTVIGLYLGVTAVLEQVAPGLVFPRYIVNEQIGLQFGRARGPFAGSEAMATSLALCAGAAGMLVSRRLRGWSQLGFVVAPLALFGVVLAITRSVWVGVAVGLLVALVLEPGLRRWLPAMVAGVVAAALAIVTLLPQVLDNLTERTGEALPVYDRLSSNAAALRLLGDLPLTGIGWRRFYPYGSEWARQSDTLPMNNAVIEVHNVVLSRASELGIPAVLVFIAIMALGPVRSFLRGRNLPATSELRGWSILSAFVFTVWFVASMFGPMASPFPNLVTWLFAGVATPDDVGTAPTGAAGHRAEMDASLPERREGAP